MHSGWPQMSLIILTALATTMTATAQAQDTISHNNEDGTVTTLHRYRKKKDSEPTDSRTEKVGNVSKVVKSDFFATCPSNATQKTEADGSQTCVLAGGGNTYQLSVLKHLEESCSSSNVYPLSIAIQQDGCKPARITATCFSSLRDKSSSKSGNTVE